LNHFLFVLQAKPQGRVIEGKFPVGLGR